MHYGQVYLVHADLPLVLRYGEDAGPGVPAAVACTIDNVDSHRYIVQCNYTIGNVDMVIVIDI